MHKKRANVNLRKKDKFEQNTDFNSTKGKLDFSLIISVPLLRPSRISILVFFSYLSSCFAFSILYFGFAFSECQSRSEPQLTYASIYIRVTNEKQGTPHEKTIFLIGLPNNFFPKLKQSARKGFPSLNITILT